MIESAEPISKKVVAKAQLFTLMFEYLVQYASSKLVSSDALDAGKWDAESSCSNKSPSPSSPPDVLTSLRSPTESSGNGIVARL